ncbi:hypothetical protein [Streptomyces griseus]|uniref:hypothetical protein n=1 Tax=Streptomyces griseus TaxID=1911 RepID=UPI0037A4AD5D
MDEVDGVAAVRQIEVMGGGLVARDVVADDRAGVDVRRVNLDEALGFSKVFDLTSTS